jgi:phosphate transport system permease protein
MQKSPVLKSPAQKSLLEPDARTRRRNAAEKRFRAYGAVAIAIGLSFLVILLTTIIMNGRGAFQQTYLSLPVYLDPAKLDKNGNRDPGDIAKVSTFGYAPLIQTALLAQLRSQNIATPLEDAADMKALISPSAAATVRNAVIADVSLIGQTVTFDLLASSRVDGYLKDRVTRDAVARDKNIDAVHLDLVDALKDAGVVAKGFNLAFITGADASESRPEQAGMGVAALGSLAMMAVVLADQFLRHRGQIGEPPAWPLD